MFKVDNKLKNANNSRTIRFTDELFERLKTVSKNNKVSFNNLVLQCCDYALQEMEKERIVIDIECDEAEP